MSGCLTWKVAVILIVLVISISGCATSNKLENEPKMPITQKHEELTSNIQPGSGPAENAPEGDGPWNHRIMLAKSMDGLNWVKTGIILADQASVPEIIVDHDGNLRVYYVDWFNGGLSVAISSDGENWVYRRVEGLTPEWVDPDVVLLPDGRYRLYASYMPLDGDQDRIVSAISEDGIVFTVEEGYRYREPGSMLTDPDVFQFKGRWYMIVGPELTLLESDDGLTFTKVGKLPLKGSVSCTIPYNGGLRIYFHRHAGAFHQIYSAYTTNLENWTEPVLVLSYGEPGSPDQYGVGDPSVVKFQGGYVMVYKTWINPPPWAANSNSFGQ